jgi:hypothetical protein
MLEQKLLQDVRDAMPNAAFGAALSDAGKRFFGAAYHVAGDFGEVTGASYLTPLIVTVLVVVAIAFAVFMGIFRSSNPVRVLTGPLDLFAPSSPIVIDRGTTASQMAATYTLAFYLRVDTVPDMRTFATPLFTWPGVWNLGYTPAHEQLVWTFKQTGDGGNSATEDVVLPGVPLQRWTQIVLVFEGRTVDLFVNGDLVKSVTLTNVPPAANSSITVVPGGLVGQLATIQLWIKRQTSAAIAANYESTSDSQGRPYLAPGFFSALTNIKTPNMFCANGSCGGAVAKAAPSQAWEFPYQ